MRETRNRPLEGLEVRQDEEGNPVGIAGYALRFYDPADSGTEFRMAENVVERIMPGSVQFDDDMISAFNHSSNQLLGRQSSGTARFSIDSQGMRFDVDLPDTTVGRDVRELIRRKDVRGASFAFQIVGDGEDVRKEDGKYIRELRSIRVFEAGPVVNPAYEATSVDMRAVEAARSVPTRIEDNERETRFADLVLTDRK